MKYIDADKLKKRIEKLDMESCISEEWTGFYYAIDSVLEVIDSLQKEQPKVDLETAARYVYESWMGGTMDDVRRDMAELGKVLNARKDE